MTTCETVSDSIPDDEWLRRGLRQRLQLPRRRGADPGRVREEHPVRAGRRQVRRTTRTTRSRWSAARPPTWCPTRSRSRTAPPSRSRSPRSEADQDLRAAATRVNGGADASRSRPRQWKGGERYGDTHDDYYARVPRQGHRHRVRVTRSRSGSPASSPGRARSAASRSPTRWPTDIGGDVLILAAEDVTGISPAQGVTTREVRRRLRRRAHGGRLHLRRLRRRRQRPHRAAPPRRAVPLRRDRLGVRRRHHHPRRRAGRGHRGQARARPRAGGARLPQRGRQGCWSTGKYNQFAQAADGAYFYNPFAPPECTTPREYPCLPLLNDFQQYWLGAYNYVSDGGTGAGRQPVPASAGRRARSPGSPARSTAATRPTTRTTRASLLATSSFLPAARVPAVRRARPRWTGHRPGCGAVRPVARATGTSTASRRTRAGSGSTRTVDLTGATSGELQLPDLVRHRARLGLRRGRGARGRHRQLDDAARTPTATPPQGTGE